MGLPLSWHPACPCPGIQPPIFGRTACEGKASTTRRKTMDALQISTFGKPSDVVELVKIPDPDDPGTNEVLVAMEYAPIDFSDLLMITGHYGVWPALPTGICSARR